MAQVSNLKIKIQGGTESTYLATWDFDPIFKYTVPGSSGVSVGDWVTIKSGATWYNGVGIDSWVFGEEWKVIELNGSRAVLNENRRGTNRIMSPIHVNNLNGGTASPPTTESVDALDHYTVAWYYDSGDNIWFSAGESDTKEKYSTYDRKSNALRVKCVVTPVSKTREVNGNETPWWTGTAVATIHSVDVDPPEVPDVPTVEIDKYELTASLENIRDGRSDEIQFEVYDGTKLFSTGTGTVVTCQTSYKCKLNAGGSYRVRARSANLIGSGKVYSDWSNFTSPETTIPSTPDEITKIRGSSSTSVYLEWSKVNSAETYDVEYTTNVNHFDGSNNTTTVTGIEFNHYEQTGLETGDEYFFRVRAVNEKGESGWSGVKSVVIGKTPAAPTTWSSATTIITGDPLNLYWVHNAEDGSKETYAEVNIIIGDDDQTYTIRNPTAEDDEAEEKTKFYTVDTSPYKEGTKIKWRVRTAGITKVYGDWSIMRSVDVYAPPTLDLKVTNQNGDVINVLESFPFYIKGLAGPNTQMPIGYHVSITADEGYETVDSVGRKKIVNAGEVVYSRYIDTNDPLLVIMSAQNIDLENNISYTVTVTASMNSGLTAVSSVPLGVSWTDMTYLLDCEISIDKNNYTAFITPYCRDKDGLPVENISIAVFRREFNGTYTEIQSGLDSSKNTVVTDPHPSLDFARYRLVATDNATGAISFYDAPGYPVNCKSVIIQWDETWSNFDATPDTNELMLPLWSGSMLTLPYNIDVSENNTTDSTLVKYIGRSHPVSYYGTQIDTTGSWSVVVPKKDKDTVYGLRRLAIWVGDVYVREPSGVGYWANLSVSFSQKHAELTIPVTIDITKVEGGV